LDVSEAQEAKQLRDENAKLKKLVVDLSLDKEMLKAVIAKKGWSSSVTHPFSKLVKQRKLVFSTLSRSAYRVNPLHNATKNL